MADTASYLAFIREQGVTTAQLPDNSLYIQTSYNIAIALVYEVIACVSTVIYDQCVYNLAFDRLVNIAIDQTGQTIFADLRKANGLNTFVGGVIQSSSDVSTSESMVVPDFAKTLTLSDLQRLKTPWGRAYLELAQSAGPLWGLT
ncbi:MAG: hypothetical protein JO253_02965 [Alphaproteobacteria bacterium]|nr:hypothetical protein [Alphaproteobacteria bacterium]